jgi:hypothetical protein
MESNVMKAWYGYVLRDVDKNHHETPGKILASRAETQALLNEVFGWQRDRLDLKYRGNFVIPNLKRARNYEIEGIMNEFYLGEDMCGLDTTVWIINEPCPFNGKYCTWGSLPEEVRGC